MLDRFIQRDTEFLLHSSDAVEHGVSMGKKRFAGLLQRPAADQVILERFAVLRAFFTVVNGKAAKLRRNKVTPALQIFQQQRRAHLLRRSHVLRKFAIPAPVISGLLFSVLIAIFKGTGILAISFDTNVSQRSATIASCMSMRWGGLTVTFPLRLISASVA